MPTTQQLNCLCCKVCTEITSNGGKLAKTLHARLSFDCNGTVYNTPLPDAIWEATAANSWGWAAATFADQIRIVGSPIADPTGGPTGHGIDVVQAIELICGDVDFDTGTFTPMGASLRNSSGSVINLNDDGASYSYGGLPGSFTYSASLTENAPGNGFTFCTGPAGLTIITLHFKDF